MNPKPEEPGFCAFHCPLCGSEETGKYAAIYEKGLSQSQSSSDHIGVGLVGDGLAGMIGRSETVGFHQTELSRKTAPPPKRNVLNLRELIGAIGCAPVIAGILWVVIVYFAYYRFGINLPGVLWGLLYCALLLLLGVGIWAGWQEDKKNKLWNETEYPLLHQEWSRKWLCLRCGESFRPSQD